MGNFSYKLQEEINFNIANWGPLFSNYPFSVVEVKCHLLIEDCMESNGSLARAVKDGE